MSDDSTTSTGRLRHKKALARLETHAPPRLPTKSATTTWRSNSYHTAVDKQSLTRAASVLERDNPPVTALNANKQKRRGTSTSIANTIGRLELLLDEAVKVAQITAEAEAGKTEAQNKNETIRAETKASANVTVPLREDHKEQDKSVLRDAKAKTARADSSVNLALQLDAGRSTQKHKNDGYALKPCGPAHNRINMPLTSPASVALSQAQSPKPSLNTQRLPLREPISRRISRPQTIFPDNPTTPRAESSDDSLSELDMQRRRPSRYRQNEHQNQTSNYEEPLPPVLRLNGYNIEDDDKSDDDLLRPGLNHQSHFTQMFGINSRHESMRLAHPEYSRTLNLNGRKQIDFSLDVGDTLLHSDCEHAPVARNWPLVKKRWSALVACINTCCIGLILGIYAGEVPAIQYVIVDLDHSIILGNVVLYLGLMLSTLLLWPLPLLHGRKPYTIGGLMLALCLQVPQGIAVIMDRLPSQTAFKVMLLLSRALSGIALGLCDINVTATLLDLFGASLQSRHPHQEVVDLYDVRRHGGGMGLWLGIWSWCSIGPLSIGFMIGAFIISRATVDWGFWTSQLLLMVVILINLWGPEVRRSAFRRTLVELMNPAGEFARVARGEIKMHLRSVGPSWWGEEVAAGYELTRMMLKQVGFSILAIYTAWVYAQFVLVLMLIGSLASVEYRLRPIPVGLCALSLAIGALLATPFQKASWLSRARSRRPRTDSMTFEKTVVWTSHLARRTVFTLALPVAAVIFTVTSRGHVIPIAVPCVIAAIVAFFSCMAISECHGILLETFDTSDLQPGMTGKPARRSVVQRYRHMRTNFSCYPRIMAGVSIIQALKYGFAAAATGVTGRVTRSIGAMKATAVVASILLGLTILLTLVLVRWNVVQMLPETRVSRDGSIWEPLILGTPSGTTRKISILEAGKMTRWSEIRRRNRLESSLTGAI